MKKFLQLFLGTSIGLSMFIFAQQAQALTAELVSISPEATDRTDMLQVPDDNTIVFGWEAVTETEYTVVFSVDEQPAVVINPGGRIEAGDITYDEEAGTLTVVFTATGLVGDSVLELTALALVDAAEETDGPPEPGSGPPAAMRGSFMSTNVLQWLLIPPSPDNPAFGFQLTGAEGEEGFFRMLIPDAVVDLLSEFAEVELEAEDLAVVVDDQIATLNVSEVEGGYLVDINIIFEADNTQIASEGTVSREIVVEQQPVLSLALAKQVSAGKAATLKAYLNLANGKNKGKTLDLYRKRGNKKYTLVASKKVKVDSGKVVFSRKVTSKTDKYKVRYKKAKSAAKVSNIVTVSPK